MRLDQKGMAPIFVVIGVLAVAVVAGAYWFSTQKVSQPALLTPPPSTQTPSPTPDETANWKIYVNTKYGYSIKYPSNQYVRLDCPDEELNLTKRTPGETRDFITASTTCARDNRYEIEVKTAEGTKQERQSGQYFTVVKKETKVNGVLAVKYIVTANANAKWEDYPGDNSSYIEILVKRNNYTYNIYFANKDFANKDLEALYDQILSTFKFIQ